MNLISNIKHLFRAINFSLVLIFGYNVAAQEQTIKLSSADEKKIAKADKDAQKVDALNKDADKIYSEIATKQSELTAEETEKLNNKALEKQIEALKIQQEANKIKYNLYASKADEFWKKYTGNPDEMGYAKSLENNARLNYQAADIQYKDALGTKDKLIAFTRMTSSADMYIKAMNDMKQAFDGYSGHTYNSKSATITSNPSVPNNSDSAYIRKDSVVSVIQSDTAKVTISPVVTEAVQPSVTVDTFTFNTQPTIENVQPVATIALPPADPGASNIYQAVKINELMIDRFNKFLQDNYPENYEKYIIDFASIDFSDLESVRKAWYQRLYGDKYYLALGEEPPVQQNQTQASSSSVDSSKTNEVIEPQNVQLADNISNSETEKVAKSKNSKSKKKRETTQNVGFGSDNVADSYSSTGFSDTAMAKGFVYRIQVLACRVPVGTNELKRAYPGDIQVVESFEDNWYKYTIGPYNSFSVARDFRISCGVDGAFLAAYLNGKRINQTSALVKSGAASQNISNFSIQEKYNFKVQIAASRNELNDDVLRKIYMNVESLEKHLEDNWYKYTIDCGNDYGKACELIKNINVPGAFVVIYKNEIRITK